MDMTISDEYIEMATSVLLSSLKIELNSWEDESIRLEYLNREDIYKLAENIFLLEKHDLHILNEKLSASGRKVNSIYKFYTLDSVTESRKISSFSKNIFFKNIHDDAGEAITALHKLDRIIGSKHYVTHRY